MRDAEMSPPGRLAHRPRDSRGFVVPYTQHVGPDGTPDFRVMDVDRVNEALRRRLCSMCGGRIERDVYFIGGPLCVANGYFYDPPMHRDCAVYAMTTCPHLARIKGRYAPVPESIGGGAFVIVGDMDTEKAEWFGLMRTSGYTFGSDRKGMTIIKARMPWRSVERWRGGERMEDDENAEDAEGTRATR
jgi:hypothetical protein